MAAPRRTTRVEDPQQLRALAHPLRLRLLGALRMEGPATATMLAARFDETSGATSYHLRQLARHGFVEEDTGRGSRRERWWRAAAEQTSWRTSDFLDAPEDRAAATWLLRQQVGAMLRQLEQWLGEQATWSAEWLGAADTSDYRLRLDPAQTSALAAELHAVIGRYQDLEPGPEAEDVALLLNLFPQRQWML